MQRLRTNRHLQAINPLPRRSQGISITQDIAPHRLEAMIDVVPLVVVDGAVRVDHGRVVALWVDIAPQRREAVEDAHT